jgi:hypothetical protein
MTDYSNDRIEAVAKGQSVNALEKKGQVVETPDYAVHLRVNADDVGEVYGSFNRITDHSLDYLVTREQDIGTLDLPEYYKDNDVRAVIYEFTEDSFVQHIFIGKGSGWEKK